MRTSIEIDDQLMNEAMQAARVKTKREAVEIGLRVLIRLHRQSLIRRYRGKLDWQGNLDNLRTNT